MATLYAEELQERENEFQFFRNYSVFVKYAN